MKKLILLSALLVSFSSFGQAPDEYLSKEYYEGIKEMIEIRGKQISENLYGGQHFVDFLVEKSIEKELIGKTITIVLNAGEDCELTSRFELSFKGKAGTGFATSDDFGMPCDPEYGDNCNFQLFIKEVDYKCYTMEGEYENRTWFEPVIINQIDKHRYSEKTKNTFEKGEEVPFSVIENVPEYPGCEEGSNSAKRKCMSAKIAKFVQRKFNTDLAGDLGLSGRQRISVAFKIDTNGNIFGIRSRGPHPRLEKEAARVINMLPKMKPGLHKGRAVVVPYSLPITFQVQD
jgi:hypothetical protein